jgi:hypothetical protein
MYEYLERFMVEQELQPLVFETKLQRSFIIFQQKDLPKWIVNLITYNSWYHSDLGDSLHIT